MQPLKPSEEVKPIEKENEDASTTWDFDSTLKRLETIVQKLEAGNVSLEESIQLFKEGMALSKRCLSALEEAEGTIQRLLDDGAIEEL